MKRIKRLSALLAAILLFTLAAPAAAAAEDMISVRTAEDLLELSRKCMLDSWSQGKIVTLEADEGYKFKKSSLRVNVKGDVYKVVSKKSTKDELKVTVDLEPYGGKIGAPVNPHWGGTTTASWQKGYRATSYMIVLKRDGRTVTSAETTSTSYDFYDYMEGGQKYTFSVVSKLASALMSPMQPT